MEIIDKLRTGFSSTARIFSVIFMLLLAASGLQAQNVLFVKSGVTDGDMITEGGVSGAAYTTCAAAVSASDIGDTIRLLEDVTTTSSVSVNRRVLDGQGHTLLRTSGNVVYTKGGTIMNLVIRGGSKGIFMDGAMTADVIIDNCDIDDVTYAIHRDGAISNPSYSLIIKNSNIRNWTSWSDAFKEVIITNTTFEKGTKGYAHLRPYGSAVIEDCSFSNDFTVATTYNNSGAIEEHPIIFSNCDIAGTPLTSDNFNDLLENHNQEASNQKGVVANGSFSTTSDGEITGGIFGGNPASLNTLCATGYAAIPLGSTPETYRVTPVYYIHFNSNGGSGTMADGYVAQDAPDYTVPTSTFTNGDWTFDKWNTKADGTGTNINVGDVMTLTTDTTLYAQWRGVAKIGDTHYTTLNAAVAAVPVGTPTTITILTNLNFWDAAGNLNNKTITFTGTPTDTLSITPDNGDAAYLVTASDADLTFETITLWNPMEPDGKDRGIAHLKKLTLNNCEVIGFMRGYASVMFTCNNCTFTKSGKYHLWTYGANCTFNNCVFNSSYNGKAINVYWNDVTNPYRVITFNDCEFNSDPVSNGSAIQINSASTCFVVNINNCNVNGYINNEPDDPNIPSEYKNLVNNKAGDAGHTTLYINGVQILKQSDCDPVAMIGDVYYQTLQSALDAAHDMTGDVTIDIISDEINTYSIVHQKAGLNITIEGNNHTCAGQIFIDGNGRASGTETLTIQNINFRGDKSHFYSGTDAFILVPSTKDASKPWSTGAYNYAHNVTVSNCDFTSTSSSLNVVGLKATSGAGLYNLVMSNGKGDNLHSFAQLTGTTGATITNDTVTNSKSFINVSGGASNHSISGCDFTSTGDSEGYGIRMKGSSSATITLSDNKFETDVPIWLGEGDSPVGTIKVESGMYISTAASLKAVHIDLYDTCTVAKVVLAGGTYNENYTTVQNYCAPYYTARDEDPAPGYCTVRRDTVAMIGTQDFPTLQMALDTAYTRTGDVTIEIVRDFEEDATILQKAGLNYTIDGNNKTLNGRIFVDGARIFPNPVGEVVITNLNFTYNTGLTYTDDTKGFLCNSKNNLSYAAHVTVSNCTFDGGATGVSDGMCAYRDPSGAQSWDITLDRLVAKNCHSLVQAVSVSGMVITNCKATDNVKNGINISGGGSNHIPGVTNIYTIANDTLTCNADGEYSIRIQEQGSAIDTFNLAGDNVFTAPKAIISKHNTACVITSASGLYDGKISIENSDAATFAFTGGTFTNLGGADDAADSTNIKSKCATGYGCYKDVAGYPAGWTVLKMYWVTYDANGGEGEMDPNPAYVDPITGDFTVPECTFTMAGYVCAGWNTKADGTGTRVTPGEHLTLTQDTVLYAQWAVAWNVNKDTYYNSLQTAVNDVNAGDTIRILRNINLTSMVNVNASTVNNFTLDLNGDTISFTGSGSNDAAIRILNGAELTIKDRGENGAIINSGKGSAVLGGYGTLVLNNGILEGTGSQTNALYIWATGTPTMGSATINGGTLKSASGMAIRHRGDVLTINGGTFTSNTGNVIQNQSNAEINGGTFTSNASYRYAIYNTGTITINDATTNGVGGALSNSGTMTVNDGTFTTNGGNAAYNSSTGVLTINDGEFQVSGSNGFRNVEQSGNTPKFYFNGGTITDAGVTQSVIYNTGKFVMTNIEVPATTADYTVWVDENGDFEAHGGKIMNTNADQSALIYGDDGNAKVTIDGTELIGTAANTYGIWVVGPNFDITMTSGSITTTKYCIVNNGSNTTNTSKWVITGGTLQSTESTAIYHAAPDTVIIGVNCTTGPTITGVNAAIEHRAGHLVIKGGTLTATADTYSVTPNASGTTTTGAAVAVAQHTTAVVTTLDISCGEFEGESSISIANPQGNTTDNVDASITGGTFTGTVHTDDDRIDEYITGGTFDDATVLEELENRIEVGYYAFDNGDGTVTVDSAYFLVYLPNGASGTMDTVAVRRISPTVATATCTFTSAGSMAFIAWNTKADGTGTSYSEGSNITLNADTTYLYAQWDGVAKIGALSFPTLQSAVDYTNDNLTGDVTIDLVKNTSEVVKILQKDGISITVNGNDNTLTGQIFIGSRQESPAYLGTYTDPNTVTIDNLNMKYDPAYFNNYGSADEAGLIYFCKNCAFGSVLNYSHNVTISNCDFDADGSNQEIYAISSIAGSVFNLNIDNCTAKNAAGLATLQSAPQFELTNCSTEDVKYGVRIVNNDGPMTVTGNNFSADEVGILVTGMTTGATINFVNDTVNAPKAFEIASSSTNGTLDITSGLYIGDVENNSSSDFFNISGGTYSEDVSGEPCAPGYAAFANGTVPETWTVTQAWFLYYDKNEVAASGTMDTVAVRRDADDAGRTVTVAACDFTWLPVHTFDKWNTKADGLGTDVAVGSTMTLTSDTTLYALWKNGYTVFYHNNSGTGTIANQSKIFDETITLSDGTGFSREGHTLYWWNTEADESGTGYALGAEYSANANLDLYAAWRSNLTMVMDSTDVVCYGQNNGTDTVKIIGGEMPFKLVLSGTEDRTVTNVMTRTYVFENLKPGAYTVTLTDTLNKDVITGTFTIAQPDTLVISSLTVPDAPCPLMGTGTYEVAMTTIGGNGSNVITWGGDATNVNATETTVTPDADDRDRTYTVNVTVTDQKGCVATATADFTVAPVIANDGTTHSNTTMTIADLSYSLLYDCDTVLRNFGTPEFVFTNPAITEGILDTIFNNVPTVAPDSVFAVGNYTIVWTARDTCGHTVTAEQVITITQQPCPSAFDYHGIEYPAVRIGCDCWTTKNLASTQYSDGRQIPDVMHYPINSRASIYGNLYTYAAAMDGATVTGTTPVQGACPEGWHIPSEAESEALMASAEVQDLMSQGLWVPDNGTNASGFNLLPGGCYNAELDRYERMYVSAYFWIAVPASYIYHACEFGAACSSTELVPGNLSNGFSIRCVMDKPTE